MSAQTYSNSSNGLDTLGYIDTYIFFTSQALSFVYTTQCIFWLVYVIRALISQVRNRRKLVALTYLETNNDYAQRIFIQKETILRNSIFLVFLCFELVFCLIINIFALMNFLYLPPDISVPIGYNCTLSPGTFLSYAYDNNWGSAMFKFIGVFIRNISFSMLIWLLGASLLHLSYAARNKLNAKAVFRFILLGFIIVFTMAVLSMIPITSLLGRITQSSLDQIVFFLVLYIANRKFFPAMNSRVIDAFHLNNTKVYLKQKRLLKRYKALVYFLLFTFELYILKDLILYNLFMIFESICTNACWFRVTLSFPAFRISDSVNNILFTTSEYLLLIAHLIDLIFYINIIAVNLMFVYVTSLQCIKRMDFYNKKKYRYRYQGFSAPLLS